MCYVENGIFSIPYKKYINQVIKEAKKNGLDIKYRDYIEDDLSINVDQIEDGRINFSRLHIVQDITNQVNLQPSTQTQQQDSIDMGSYVVVWTVNCLRYLNYEAIPCS